uniref:Uncharacterized protein n=1 Tax=Timema bartmani TaxID=61472 RepID=A0A7R9HWN7_9NEOP|nr:unnamed protein product [Timema bartmani]
MLLILFLAAVTDEEARSASVEYTDLSMENAVAVSKKLESFLEDADAYIRGVSSSGVVDEPFLLEVVECSRRPGAVAAVSEFVRRTLNSLGTQYGTNKDMVADSPLQMERMVTSAVNFRNLVRESALLDLKDSKKQENEQRFLRNSSLLDACDTLRKDFLAAGVQVKLYQQYNDATIRTMAKTDIRLENPSWNGVFDIPGLPEGKSLKMKQVIVHTPSTSSRKSSSLNPACHFRCPDACAVAKRVSVTLSGKKLTQQKETDLKTHLGFFNPSFWCFKG